MRRALSSTAQDTGTSSWMPGGNSRPISLSSPRRITLLQEVIVRSISAGCAPSVNVPAGAPRSSAAPKLGAVAPPA
jgi:hypothetical protein